MQLPRRMARFNRVVTNRVQRLWAPYLPPWLMITHVGRRSGTIYRTPVFGSVRDHEVVLGVMYGPESDWVRNITTAGHATIRRLGRTHAITDVRLVPSAEVSGWIARVADHVVTAHLADGASRATS